MNQVDHSRLNFVAERLLAFQHHFLGRMLQGIGLVGEKDFSALEQLAEGIPDGAVARVVKEFLEVESAVEEDVDPARTAHTDRGLTDNGIIEHGPATFERSSNAAPEFREKVWDIQTGDVPMFVISEMMQMVLDHCAQQEMNPADFFAQYGTDDELIRFFWTRGVFRSLVRLGIDLFLDVGHMIKAKTPRYLSLVGDAVPWETRDELLAVASATFKKRYNGRIKPARGRMHDWLAEEVSRIYG